MLARAYIISLSPYILGARRNGLTPREAHEKTVEDQLKTWKDDPDFHKMATEIRKMDEKTAKLKRKNAKYKANPVDHLLLFQVYIRYYASRS